MAKNIILPCIIGQDLWCINDDNEIEKVKCSGFIINDNYTIFVRYKERCAAEEYSSVIGGYVWLSEEEARRHLNTENMLYDN